MSSCLPLKLIPFGLWQVVDKVLLQPHALMVVQNDCDHISPLAAIRRLLAQEVAAPGHPTTSCCKASDWHLDQACARPSPLHGPRLRARSVSTKNKHVKTEHHQKQMHRLCLIMHVCCMQTAQALAGQSLLKNWQSLTHTGTMLQACLNSSRSLCASYMLFGSLLG